MLTDRTLEKIAALDATVHNPARLMILMLLSSCKEMDYSLLMERTALTSGNITTHLGKLADSGYISIHKSFRGKRPNTSLSITPTGRDAYIRWGEVIMAALPESAIQRVNARLMMSIAEQRARLMPPADIFPPDWQYSMSFTGHPAREFHLPPINLQTC
jgi:DNA-binding MarR family transcriptional regulator